MLKEWGNWIVSMYHKTGHRQPFLTSVNYHTVQHYNVSFFTNVLVIIMSLCNDYFTIRRHIFTLSFFVITVCRYKAHKKCAVKAQKSCKWTTIDCIPADDRLVGVGVDEVRLVLFHSTLFFVCFCLSQSRTYS